MTEYPTPTDDPRRSESFSCRLGPKSPWTALHLSLRCGGHTNFSFIYWGQLRRYTHLEPSSFSKPRSLLNLEVTRLHYGETLFLMCFLTNVLMLIQLPVLPFVLFFGGGVQSFSRFLSRYRGLFSFRSYLWRVCTYIDFSTQPFRLPSHNMFINTLKWKPHQVCLLLPFPFLPLDQLDMLPLFPILKICTFFKNGKIIQIP